MPALKAIAELVETPEDHSPGRVSIRHHRVEEHRVTLRIIDNAVELFQDELRCLFGQKPPRRPGLQSRHLLRKSGQSDLEHLTSVGDNQVKGETLLELKCSTEAVDLLLLFLAERSSSAHSFRCWAIAAFTPGISSTAGWSSNQVSLFRYRRTMLF